MSADRICGHAGRVHLPPARHRSVDLGVCPVLRISLKWPRQSARMAALERVCHLPGGLVGARRGRPLYPDP
jgi:hypothetical protein